MAKKIDVTWEVRSGMVVWPGDDGVTLERTMKMEEGARNNVSRITCGVHTGTHLDAPYHFLKNGKTMETLSLDVLIGPAWVADFEKSSIIDSASLESAAVPAGTTRLLIRTSNSKIYRSGEKEFRSDYVGLDVSGAEWIVNRGIQLVGIDYLSVATRSQTGPVHLVLLSKEIILVEGLDLEEALAGPCRMYCLPLKLVGSDGAPARVVLEYE